MRFPLGVAGAALVASSLSCAAPQKPAAAAPDQPAAAGEAATSGRPTEAGTPPAGDERAFQASGEVFFLAAGGPGTSAAFDDRRVVGASVNLTRGAEGDWSGGLASREVVLSIAPDQIAGAGAVLRLEREGDTTWLRGIWFEERVSLEITPRGITGRAGPTCSVEVERRAPGVYEGSMACVVQQPGLPQRAAFSRATLRLVGDAALPDPPMPQLALALVAVLPR